MGDVPTPEEMAADPALRKATYDKIIREDLGIDPHSGPGHHLGPLIDMADIATLSHMSPHAAAMARQRTAAGRARRPFPQPDPDEGSRFADKPLWRAYEVLDYYVATENWPLGSKARGQIGARGNRPPVSRPEEKVNWSTLYRKDRALAEQIKNARLNDGSRRSPEQWKWRLDNATRAA